MNFKSFWSDLIDQLRPGDVVKNWTVAKGYLGDEFQISEVTESAVFVVTPNAENQQRVPKADFELMYELWQPYISGRIGRREIADESRFSKYTISIIKHLKANRRSIK